MIDPTSPFSAVVQKLSRRDGTALLIALLLAYGLVAFGLATTVMGMLRWLIGSTATASFLVAIGTYLYAFIFKPERLRSEETARMDMMLSWLVRPDVDDDHRTSAERLLPIVLETKLPKGKIGLSKPSGGRDDV